GPLTNLEPADSSIAVGPEQVVQVVNAAVRFTDRQGTALITDVGLAAFFAIANRHVSSPRVIYDPLHGRWLAIEESWDCITSGSTGFGHGFIDLAVSRTTDPTGVWDVYNQLAFPNQLPDLPTMGLSSDKVGIAANLYPIGPGCAFGDLAGTYLAGLDWSALLARSSTIGSSTTDPDLFGVQVAGQTPALTSALQFIGQAADGSGDIEYFRGDGTTAGHTFSLGPVFDLAADGVLGPSLPLGGLLPQQPGTGAITADIDNRLTGAAWQSNRLTATSTYPCHPAGDDADRLCVRVSQLDTSAASASVPPSRVQDFLLNQAGRDTFVGGVGSAADGTLHVVFNRSSGTAGDFISSYAVEQRPGAAANQVSPAILLAAGLATYRGSEWGDDQTVAPDPQIAASVWQAGPSANGAGGWSTFVDRLGATAATTYVPITSIRVVDTRAGGVNGLSGLAGKFVANTARSFGVTGLGSGPDQIPDDAVAVTGNLTVTGQTSAGYVSLTPDLTNTPSSSTINFPLGDVRANNV
ncbi:MAG TPA: hypothetical protein VIB99_03320, partial [Candidatus Limnocylindrales bacterium]